MATPITTILERINSDYKMVKDAKTGSLGAFGRIFNGIEDSVVIDEIKPALTKYAKRMLWIAKTIEADPIISSIRAANPNYDIAEILAERATFDVTALNPDLAIVLLQSRSKFEEALFATLRVHEKLMDYFYHKDGLPKWLIHAGSTFLEAVRKHWPDRTIAEGFSHNYMLSAGAMISDQITETTSPTALLNAFERLRPILNLAQAHVNQHFRELLVLRKKTNRQYRRRLLFTKSNTPKHIALKLAYRNTLIRIFQLSEVLQTPNNNRAIKTQDLQFIELSDQIERYEALGNRQQARIARRKLNTLIEPNGKLLNRSDEMKQERGTLDILNAINDTPRRIVTDEEAKEIILHLDIRAAIATHQATSIEAQEQAILADLVVQVSQRNPPFYTREDLPEFIPFRHEHDIRLRGDASLGVAGDDSTNSQADDGPKKIVENPQLITSPVHCINDLNVERKLLQGYTNSTVTRASETNALEYHSQLTEQTPTKHIQAASFKYEKALVAKMLMCVLCEQVETERVNPDNLTITLYGCDKTLVALGVAMCRFANINIDCEASIDEKLVQKLLPSLKHHKYALELKKLANNIKNAYETGHTPVFQAQDLPPALTVT